MEEFPGSIQSHLGTAWDGGSVPSPWKQIFLEVTSNPTAPGFLEDELLILQEMDKKKLNIHSFHFPSVISWEFTPSESLPIRGG